MLLSALRLRMAPGHRQDDIKPDRRIAGRQPLARDPLPAFITNPGALTEGEFRC
ncbi:hypothetical protein [Larkinella ripae]